MEMEMWWSKQKDTITLNRYRYNGKEQQRELGWDWYNYGARYYDASVGRFSSIDRFADKFAVQSPYAYGANSPIRFIDVNGDSTRVYNLIGAYQYTINDPLPNEDHFVSQGLADAMSSGASDKRRAAIVRNGSEFFIGAKTRDQMSVISEVSSAEGLERAFVLALGENSKELQAIDITGDASRSSNHVSFSEAMDGANLQGTGLLAQGILI